MRIISNIRLIVAIIFVASTSFAEQEFVNLEESNTDQIMQELNKSDETKRDKIKMKETTKGTSESKTIQSNFDDLSYLIPFSEVGIIQKKYFPKSERFNLVIGGSMVTNNAFFSTSGFFGRLGYYFVEDIGLEFQYMSLHTISTTATDDLKKLQGVDTDNLVYPESFSGLDFVFVPTYGKMTWFNNKIIPFELLFLVGAGSTATQTKETPTTMRIGVAQTFALTRSSKLRLDLLNVSYSAKGVSETESVNNNILLNIGYEFYFPEAKYR